MPAVNRESSLVAVQSLQLEQTEAPSTAKPIATQQEVESFDESKSQSPIRQHGIAVGSLSASSVMSLDARVAVAQVKELMGGFVVSGDDCRHAIGLLQSLPPAQYQKALKALSESGDLKTLCQKVPNELRRDLAESAVQGGATTKQAERFPPGIRDPQPPIQPALIYNLPSLPKELREVIHKENTARAYQYEEALKVYVDAYCAKVATCRTPMELRAVGPLSTPPALTEPGLSEADFAAQRFASLNTHSDIGSQRANKAVSEQVSIFRKELAAGSFGLDFKFKAQVKSEMGGPSHSELAGGAAFLAKGTLTSDGRVIGAGVEGESLIEGGYGPLKLEAKLTPEGHVDAVSADVLIAGAELDRDGKMTFKAKVAPGAAVETFADPNKGNVGAAFSVKNEATIFGIKREYEVKVGFTAKGIAREYYQDIGGAQTGFFGSMPELDAGVKWADLKKDRREWYERQGFTQETWAR